MTERNVCGRHKLAAGNIGLVEECRCGKIHLSVGPVTLHFELEAFEALTCTMNAAVREAHVRKHRAANDLRLLLGEKPQSPTQDAAPPYRPD